MSWIIKPINIITGASAPGIVSFCEKRDDAVIDAQSKSALSRYKNWHFNMEVKKCKDNIQKSKNIVYEEEV